MRRIGPGLFLLLLLSIGCDGTSRSPDANATEALRSSPPALLDREPCADRVASGRALFGDLHVHTSRSMDAYLFDTRTTPSDAYRFAKGEAIRFGALGPDGVGTQIHQLDRPLDFAAVTDHAENFGPVSRCTRPDSPVFETEACRLYRGDGRAPVTDDFMATVQYIRDRTLSLDDEAVCGLDGRPCRDAEDDFWTEVQTTAEQHYDRTSACRFTTFVAYEYSLTPQMSKIHRNVIFRNEVAIDRPIHALAEPDPLVMLRRLRDECNDGKPGCEALAIPHNPNHSDGRMFRAEYPGVMNALQEARFARLRAEMEPIVEMMQIKGDSECRNGLVGVGGPVDELCDFEKMRSIAAPEPPDCEGEPGVGALAGGGCVDRNAYVRTALVAGLAEEERIGANPFEFGFIGSTDAHDGTMGDVAENGNMSRGGRGSERISTNPGGLAGVWAEENTRDAIFDALSRRETFSTSGPRIEPRFFAGTELAPDLCARPDAIEHAYRHGVPMGGELDLTEGASPRFFVTADRDPGAANVATNPLERIQIVKGFVGEDGRYETRVFDAAGEAVPDEMLSLDTCEPVSAGSDTLCGVWEDPEFDPARAAVYYARVVEVPSCRWSTLFCNGLDDADRPPACDDPSVPKRIRERAWTSPIWVRPANGA